MSVAAVLYLDSDYDCVGGPTAGGADDLYTALDGLGIQTREGHGNRMYLL